MRDQAWSLPYKTGESVQDFIFRNFMKMASYLLEMLTRLFMLSVILVGLQGEDTDNYKRTIVLIKKESHTPQYLYLRGGGPGGIDIPIRHRIKPTNEHSFYAVTQINDDVLDWHGAETDQGKYDKTITPQGTPMMWTTNDSNFPTKVEDEGAGYWSVNKFGDHYWGVDLDMDCSKTSNGWFEFKGFFTSDGQTPVPYGNGWEINLHRTPCDVSDLGDAAPSAVEPIGANHVGLCGTTTVVEFGKGSCKISKI